MPQEMPNQETTSTDNSRSSLFITIKSEADAIVSRDRAAIAGSLLCIFSLLAAIQFFLQGLNINPSASPDAATEQMTFYASAGINIFLIFLIAAAIILIAVKNSRVAAVALLAFAVFDTAVYGMNVLSNFASAPTTILGLLLGGVARFFVVVTALNSLQGVIALQRYKQVDEMPIH